MNKFFKRFTHKNEKILRRELTFAHTSVALLALGMAIILLTADMVGGVFDHTLAIVASTLLVVVALISACIVGHIISVSKKK